MRPLRRVPDIPAASLADIAFLLLIFFLITAAITTVRGFHLTLPAEEDKGMILLRQEVLLVRLANDASLTVDGQAVEGRVLAAFLEEQKKERTHLSVILEVARACPYGEFARAAHQIRLAGFERFAIKGIE
jgi:biopolymer transport protein ExbD